MDTGEDRSSHDYMEYDYVTQGAYGCLPDGSLVGIPHYTGSDPMIKQ